MTMSDAGGLERMDEVMVDDIIATRERLGRTVMIGLCGPQGSGKSSTAQRLVERLGALGLKAVARSLDDFYLTRQDRGALARTIHPLLATRGVPGTHDLAMLHATLDQLASAQPGAIVALPTFDKTTDDRAPRPLWPSSAGCVDVVILEGWCVGARPQPHEALEMPVNALETIEDPDATWRTSINDQLAGPYAALFGRLDRRYLLRAPSFDVVFQWRAEQENGLERPQDGSRPPMTESQLRRFIAHYERLTLWLAEDEPADLVVDIGIDRAPLCLRWT